MAIFLSKRLIRFTVLVGVILLIVITLGNHTASSDFVSSYLPVSIDFSTYTGFGNKNQLTAEELAAESRRHEVEQAVSEGKIISDEPTDPETAKLNQALKEAAESAEAIEDLSGSTKDTMSFIEPSFKNKGKRPKACFVTLVRNSELGDMVGSIKKVQARFNEKFKYDWVFLNDELFTDEFKAKIKELIPNSVIKFGLIPKEHWSYPEYIDQTRAADTRVKMADIIYGSSESYRHMCRFQSGFFWRHPLLDDYDWYWRVEPSINIYCDINYDVFQWMQDNEKVYGFTITIHEFEATIPTLWKSSMDFFKEHPEFIAEDNLSKFITEDKGKSYNLCHFWSNFEIVNLNLWRSPAYQAYFEYLDHKGGFFYERWGDAPVHSIAASMLLPKDKIHYFSDIGYHHPPYDNCPINDDVWKQNNCDCDQKNDFTFKGYACGKQYYEAQGLTKPSNWEQFTD